MKISNEAKVGVFAIAIIAILYVGFNYLKGIEFFRPTARYYAVYSDVADLNVSNPVKINGFTVGRVSDIRLLQEKNNEIIVEMDISEDIVLGDTTVALLDVDLLGSVSIVLQVGSIANPIESGDTLRSALAKGLQEILVEGARPIADNLQSTIRRINTILDNLSGSSNRINDIIINTEQITSRINYVIYENRAEFNKLLKNFNVLTDSLNYTVSRINPLLDKYGAVADSLKEVDLQATLDKTNETLDTMNELVLKLSESEGTMHKLLTDDSLYNNLNKTIEDLDRLIIHLDQNPKHFFAPLGKSKSKIEKDRRKEEDQ